MNKSIYLGNTILSILNKRHELGELIPDNSRKTKWLALMFNLRMFARLISAKELNEHGVKRLNEAGSVIIKNLQV